MGVAHGESDLQNSLFFLLFSPSSSPSYLPTLLFSPSLSSLYICLMPLSLTNLLPYFSGHKGGNRLPTGPQLYCLPVTTWREIPLPLSLGVSLLTHQGAGSLVVVAARPGQPALHNVGLRPSFLMQAGEVRPTGSPSWGLG